MSKKMNEISEAELEVIKVLWANDKPTTAQEVCDSLVNKEWKYTTISTLLSRMVEKGTVAYEKRGRFYYYYPTVSKREYETSQTKLLISNLYNGSVKNLVVSLFKNKQMSKDDIDEIKKLFDLEG